MSSDTWKVTKYFFFIDKKLKPNKWIFYTQTGQIDNLYELKKKKLPEYGFDNN